jgi:hypothetical protein
MSPKRKFVHHFDRVVPPPHPPLSHQRLCHKKEKTNFSGSGGAVGWKRFRAVSLYNFGFRRTKRMNRFGFIQMMISHNIKGPHSKALEPGRFSARIAITTQGRGSNLGYFLTIAVAAQQELKRLTKMNWSA